MPAAEETHWLDDTEMRAWRGLRRFEGRSSRRTWLYKIATNTCLDEIARRPKRVLPAGFGPATPMGEGLGAPLVESVWVEPYPDERLADVRDAPGAREGREVLQALERDERPKLVLWADADPVLLQYIGGKFVTIFPPQAAIAEAVWPMK